MRQLVREGILLTALALAAGTAAQAQRVREIRMTADAEREIYRFEPAKVVARPGDVLLFKAAIGAPHSIVFEPGGLSPRVREALNSALPRRTGDLSSPLLARNGAEYRIVVPALPAGSYGFYCLPHRAYDMRGVLVIE